MTTSLYLFSVPLFLRHLAILTTLLESAERQAKDRGIDPEALITARLFPDMFPLAKQVRAACDTARRAAARLSGEEPADSQDTDKTFADLYKRIRDTVGHLQRYSPDGFVDSEDLKVKLSIGPNAVTITTRQYLIRFALPNFYFHVTTAYDILRHNGFALGKRDFLGSMVD
jgi:hypothetical protein